MELFAKMLNGWKLLTNIPKNSILFVLQGSEYVSPKGWNFSLKIVANWFQKISGWVHTSYINRSSCWQMLFKIGALKNFATFTGKHLCWSLFLITQVTLTQLFFSKYCEIFSNSFFHGTPPVAAFLQNSD